VIDDDEIDEKADEVKSEELDIRDKEFVTIPELETIYFGYDSSTLSKEARDTLSDNVKYLTKHAELDITAELAKILKEKTSQIDEKLVGINDLRMHGQNKWLIHFLLARITRHIEQRSGIASNFQDYINRKVDRPFQVEHI